MKKEEKKEIPGEKLIEDGGVIKEILVEGSGDNPKINQEVVVTYIGVWTNGEAMDKIVSVKAPYRFTVGVGQVMQGWDIAIPTMKRGEKAKVTIDPKYASGWPTCPPYFPYDAKAQYEIEMLDFYPKRMALGTWKVENLKESAEEYKARGKEYFLAGKLKFAMYCYYEALRFVDAIETPSVNDKEMVKTLKTNVAVCLFKESLWDDTIKMCNEILKLAPDTTKASYLRGMSLSKLWKCDEAVEDLKKVIEATPDDLKAKAEYEKLLKKKMPKKPHKKSQYAELFDTNMLYEEKSIKQKSLPGYNPANPRIYIDFYVGKKEAQRVIAELFYDKVPKTVENFKSLCTGEKSKDNPRLKYSGCKAVAVNENFGIILGDLDQRMEGKLPQSNNSIYGATFADENFTIPHRAGVFSMHNTGANTNGSKFVITFKDCPSLDGKQVGFGRVVKGMDVIKELAKIPVDDHSCPKLNVWIDCGAYPDQVKDPENC